MAPEQSGDNGGAGSAVSRHPAHDFLDRVETEGGKALAELAANWPGWDKTGLPLDITSRAEKLIHDASLIEGHREDRADSQAAPAPAPAAPPPAATPAPAGALPPATEPASAPPGASTDPEVQKAELKGRIARDQAALGALTGGDDVEFEEDAIEFRGDLDGIPMPNMLQLPGLVGALTVRS